MAKSELGSLSTLIGDLCYASASEAAWGDRGQQMQAEQQREKKHELEQKRLDSAPHRTIGKGFTQGFMKSGSKKVNEGMQNNNPHIQRPLPEAPKFKKSDNQMER